MYSNIQPGVASGGRRIGANALAIAVLCALASPGMALAAGFTAGQQADAELIAQQDAGQEAQSSTTDVDQVSYEDNDTSHNTGGEWTFYFDNTLNWNFGVRASSIDDKIGNNPNFDESEYKFKDAGDVVTNRVSLLSEFGGDFNDKWGFRISAQGWHDFAYNDKVRHNPGIYAPAGGGLPAITYADIRSYSGGKYTDYVNKFYRTGGQLLDAFVYFNTEVGDKPFYIKAGRLTQYWGNGLLHPWQSLSYSQGGMDGAAAAAAPGTQAKAVFIPRTQINLALNVTPEITIGAQYFFEYTANRLPEGGTFLAPADFFFTNQSQFFAGAVPSAMLGLSAGGWYPLLAQRIETDEPDENDGNWGAYVRWQSTPAQQWGLYYRRFDEVQPWAPMLAFDPSGAMPVGYFLSYNRKASLVGLTLDAAAGNSSIGMELTWMKDKALNSTPMPYPLADVPGRGATGEVLNLIANAMVPLGSTPLYHSGTLIAELAYTRLLDVDATNRNLFNGEGYMGCAGTKWDGCSTKNAVSAAVVFEPQWNQVFPGIDLSAPINITHAIKGNGAVVGGPSQGSTTWSVGVSAIFGGKNSLKLAYVGSHAHTKGIAYTPSGLAYYAGGNGNFASNDRDWVSLTFSAPF